MPTRRIVGLTLALAIVTGSRPSAAAGDTDSVAAFLARRGRPPAEYVLSTLDAHRVVIVGEGHWLRADAKLIAQVVPGLARRNAALAVEVFAASEQARIDSLLAAPAWDATRANAILRASAWPYREYRDVLRAAWQSNRGARPESALRIVALGPPADWRQSLLPTGVTYDGFMASLVIEALAGRGRRVLVYCGMHHAFTRYAQAELDLAGRATAYMDRMGNQLWRRFGERVFLIALHRPLWCGSTESPTYCLPFDGLLDCAAARGAPVGFDVAGSPLAGLALSDSSYYAHGHPGLRFQDWCDGYVWSGPLEGVRLTSLIPLDEYAPDEPSLREAAARNPFSDEPGLSRARLEELWRKEAASAADPLASRGWAHLRDWRGGCGH